MIPFTQQAANACNYCRTRKQRCDRTLPSCSRCTAKLRQCGYVWIKDDPDSTEPGPLIIHRGDRGTDLSTRGRDLLLHAFTACINRESGSTIEFSILVYDLLGPGECKISVLIEEHATSMHQWRPLIDEDLLRKGKGGTHDDCPPELLPSPLQLLCVYMLNKHVRPHAEHASIGILYTTIKQLLAIGQAAGEVSLDWLRASMLVAVYECAHGMARQAFITLSSCAAQFDLIRLDIREPNHELCSDAILPSLNVAIIMLDRMISLSSIAEALPLVCPTNHPRITYIANKIEPAIPPPSPTPYATSPRKVHIRAIVALASGRVLEYSHAVQRRIDPVEKYDDVDAAVALVIKKLVDKPQPHTWLHCDAIAMAFCSHLLLQQTQVEQLQAQNTSLSDPAAMKAFMALQHSRRMAWDMVHVMIGKIKREDDFSFLPFAGVCCVIRAAIAVLETRRSAPGDEPSTEEVNSFLIILD